jgi:protochlorophyllide reductase
MTSRLVLAGVRLSGQSAEKGARAQLYAAAAPDVKGGDYFGPKRRLGGPVALSGMSPRARDETAASRLWDVSKQLTGVDIDTAIAAAGG